MTNSIGLIHASFGNRFSLQKQVIMNVYDGSLVQAQAVHRGKVISSQWIKVIDARVLVKDPHHTSQEHWKALRPDV